MRFFYPVVTNGNKPALAIGALLRLDDSVSMRSVAVSEKAKDARKTVSTSSKPKTASTAKRAPTVKNVGKERNQSGSETII